MNKDHHIEAHFSAPRTFVNIDKLHSRLYVFAFEHNLSYLQMDTWTPGAWVAIKAHFSTKSKAQGNLVEALRALEFDDLHLVDAYVRGEPFW